MTDADEDPGRGAQEQPGGAARPDAPGQPGRAAQPDAPGRPGGAARPDAPGQPGGLTLIACPAVLGEMAEGATAGVTCRQLEAQLHVSPERLKVALRQAVAEADEPGATIVLGYGMCSNAVLGLTTRHATLVVPRVDDCIAMLLGSNEAYAAQSEQARGTYYVARAYLEECDTIFSEHEKLVARRGLERAEKMMRLLLAHYTRIVLIDTGRYDLEPHRADIAEFAERFDLVVEDVPGTTRIVDALVAGEWGDDFVVAPPGHELTLADFRPGPSPGGGYPLSRRAAVGRAAGRARRGTCAGGGRAVRARPPQSYSNGTAGVVRRRPAPAWRWRLPRWRPRRSRRRQSRRPRRGSWARRRS